MSTIYRLPQYQSWVQIIKLTQGKETLVDDQDFEWLSQWKWHARNKRDKFYAVRNEYHPETKQSSKIYMHSVLCPLPDGFDEIDHQNRNTLDNRRSNLRPTTRAQNSQNCFLRKHSSTGFVGVHFVERLQQFTAKLRNKHIGCFATAIEAAHARDEAARAEFGTFGTYNFPREGERSAR